MQHADAAFHVFDGVVAGFDEGAQAGAEGFDVLGQQAGLDFLEQRLHHEQGIGFAGVKPEAGQLLLVAGAAGVAVTAFVAVPLDGCVEAAAHVLQVALEGGQRHLQLAQHAVDGHDFAALQQAVYPVKTLGPVHGVSLPEGGLIL